MDLTNEHAVDIHSIHCIRCGELADGRECIDGKDTSGEAGQVCPTCQNKCLHCNETLDEEEQESNKVADCVEGKICPTCQIMDEYCGESDNGKHEPDFASVGSADVVQDPDHWVFDVNCKHCGRSGAFRVDPETEIDW